MIIANTAYILANTASISIFDASQYNILTRKWLNENNSVNICVIIRDEGSAIYDTGSA